MNVEVTKDIVKILEGSEQPHKEEYNITKCTFTFDEFTDSFPVKVAVFTVMSTNESYARDIINNECEIPNEVLKYEFETVKLGVYGYDVETVNEEEVLKQRYSPSYDTFVVPTGSYVEGAKTAEMITPSQYDIYSAKLQEGLDTLDDAVAEIETMDIDAVKEGKITSITITRKDGTTKEVQLEDGKSIEFNWQGTSLGIRQEGESVYQYVNLKGDTGAPGAIKMEIVNELPQTGSEDTIYLVPNDDPETGNNYDEYIYVNDAWEKLGGIQVEVDLTDYVKFTDYATSSKAGVVKTMNGFKVSATTGNAYAEELTYANYQQYGGGSFVGKGTLEAVIAGKGLVSNTNYATSSTGGVIKTETGLGTYLNANGTIQASTRTYSQYNGANNELFIGKGTLENVIAGKNLETANNKVTTISSSSTDTQYPTAKCMYDLVGNVETLLETLDIGSGARELE